ncbi:ATP-dependent nuclease [Slackia exigua]|uniref:ATP-dependent nuclease n=1 Tax=Slackia exigua TaxID=84109 RepID=UPI0023F232E1|nr:TOPRIM nucleotidyl transferase/hydrolase domain-containing protein [Slackia exigua]
MPGKLTILIGPNGYGKTTRLEEIKKGLATNGKSVFSIPSEILLLDEIKDTKDTSQTMEYLLTELIQTPKYEILLDDFFSEVDKTIAHNVSAMNDILDEILSMNGSSRTGDFISSNPNKRAVKSLVAINQKDVKNKMGSGQRMSLLLKLASKSTRDYIFLDEPEQYSHPSMLHSTALAINDLVGKGKHVYIATHSPKLVSMLDIDYSNIKVINDISHSEKDIPFDYAVSEASKHFNVNAMKSTSKPYYISAASLKECIQRRHNRQFIEALFSKRVYLCEGANDEHLINAALREHGGYFDDYVIFKVWGKPNLPVFAYLFNELSIKTIVLYDKDDVSQPFHKESNDAINSLPSSIPSIEQDPNLESELKFLGKKGDALAFMNHLESISIPSKFDLKKY